MKINITSKMQKRAEEEARKRNPDIHHHFEVSHLTSFERDKIGFLGEVAACELLGIDWEKNIRKDYKTIDNGDGWCKKGIFDVKTETINQPYFDKVVNRTIHDDELYGRRLINKEQVQLLSKYDIVIFGAFNRGDLEKWYPIGWLETKYILENYTLTKYRPDGGEYPFSCLAIKTSELRSIQDLK